MAKKKNFLPSMGPEFCELFKRKAGAHSHKNVKRKKTRQKKIRIELSLASQTEETRLKNREESGLHIKGWTVRTLQVFCHYVFIMIGERMTDSTN